VEAKDAHETHMCGLSSHVNAYMEEVVPPYATTCAVFGTSSCMLALTCDPSKLTSRQKRQKIPSFPFDVKSGQSGKLVSARNSSLRENDAQNLILRDLQLVNVRSQRILNVHLQRSKLNGSMAHM